MEKIDQLKALIKERSDLLSKDLERAVMDQNDEWYSGQAHGLEDGIDALQAVLHLIESWVIPE